ncbi:MAG: 16S rRNA (cytosine(1402)-N(4))-methyltransferase RsmH [Planctomycetes bacterium]|jgi:16S rRNA (cytosine1402-N4)-methyltransferase|nr:16S rRNA (cytosine(1402)-N(4))-methyltransferase RsmH [Planctomycetota bacterium]
MNDTSSEGGSGDDREAGQPVHRPVLLREVLAVLELHPGLLVVDGTVGAAGHARAIVPCIGSDGMLIGLDRDSEILVAARETLAGAEVSRAGTRISLHHLPHSRMHEALAATGQSRCDRVLLDLGVSSLQLDRPERGFSFMADGPLDMRMDADAEVTAADWIAMVGEQELADTIFQLGDERYSRRIARRICEVRRRTPIVRTAQLADLVVAALPGAARHGRIHPATRTFQAIRMAVNDELGELERGLQAAHDCLRPGGRLAVISFHSHEDRVVKHFLRARFELVTKKPIEASPDEARQNPRSRSAKLRCGIRREEVA